MKERLVPHRRIRRGFRWELAPNQGSKLGRKNLARGGDSVNAESTKYACAAAGSPTCPELGMQEIHGSRALFVGSKLCL